MLWLNNKIGGIVNNINPKDIAFLLAANLEIEKAKRTSMKAKIALDFLSTRHSFKNCVFEVYLKTWDGKFRCVALEGVDKELYELYIDRSVSNKSLVYQIIKTQKACFDTKLKIDRSRRAEFIKKVEIKSSLFLPIIDSGVLIVNKADTKKFTKYDFNLLKYFVKEILGPSLDLAFDNEKNFEVSIRDVLTGLYNHGYFKYQLEKEIDNARRAKDKISLVMIDVDYFKNYNDLNGHPMGDKLLAKLASLFKYNTRKGDIVARYGGEEFAIILFNTDLKTAYQKAERLKKVVSNFKFEKGRLQPTGKLTISVGVANYPENAKDAVELLHKADEALYNSKKTGRNKVSVYGQYNPK